MITMMLFTLALVALIGTTLANALATKHAARLWAITTVVVIIAHSVATIIPKLLT